MVTDAAWPVYRSLAMAVDSSVVEALRAAIQRDPGNVALSLHLAGLLLEAGDPAGALDQARRVLAGDPTDRDALRIAAQAATRSGADHTARGYEQVLRALEPATAAVPSPGPEPEPEPEPAEREPEADGGDVVRLRALDGGRHDDGEIERPRVTLDDVGGLEEVKRRLNSAFLAPMRNPQLRAAYGKSLRGGLLLYGPPGCGKTFLARALAGELGASFSAVGISDVLDMYLGESERKLHEIFAAARRHAPCVLFLDELDALGQKRSQLRHSAGRNLVNQLLAELDGVQADNEGLFVLAATNHPWDVDTALRRPGRLDRMLLVLPPDPPAREAILRLHLRGRPVDGEPALDRLVKRTETFSGADLAALCEVATERALERSLESGTVEPIGKRDLEVACSEVAPSTRAWFDVAYNYAMFANEGGQYDELLDYVKRHRLR